VTVHEQPLHPLEQVWDRLKYDKVQTKLSWFSGKWNSGGGWLVSWKGHPAENFVASCHEGLSLLGQSRSLGGRASKGVGPISLVPTPVLARGAALGSHLCVALSSVHAIVHCANAVCIRQPPHVVVAAPGVDVHGPGPVSHRGPQRSPFPVRTVCHRE